MYEHFFQCPYCWETISMFLEPVNGEQRYVEDCEVCCRPIQLIYFSIGNCVHLKPFTLRNKKRESKLSFFISGQLIDHSCFALAQSKFKSPILLSFSSTVTFWFETNITASTPVFVEKTLINFPLALSSIE